MISSHLLFGGVALVAAISIIVAIVNWVLLARVSSRMSRLETEVDKKAREFDVLRKERGQSIAPSGSAVTPIPVSLDDSTMQHTALSTSNEGDHEQIEIVRNVRPTFESFAEPGSGTHAPAAPASPAPTPSAPAPRADIEISLFNPGTQYADFQELWRILSERLPHTPNPRIVIDLGHVTSLQQAEIDYLAQVCQAIDGQGGTVILTNCEQPLAGPFGANAVLGPLLFYR